MENTKKTIRNLIVFILLIILTFTIILKDVDIMEITNAFLNVKIEYIIIGIVCMCMFFVCDALNIGRILKTLNEKSTFLKNIKYSLIGFFFSSITPAATGGQPMQIYYMHKENISVANSTLTFLITLSCTQIVTLTLAFISLFFNLQYMNKAMVWFFIIGVTLNASALALLLISIYSRRMTKAIINFVIKVLKFFKVKKAEEKKEKLENELKKYQESAVYARNNRKLVIRTLLTTYVQFIFFYSISYFVYRSFGMNEHNIIELLTMQSVLYATVSGIPSPGAVGVSEGGYLAIYANIYSSKLINTAMLINRGVNFYLFVVISFVIVLINSIRDKKEQKIQKTEEI